MSVFPTRITFLNLEKDILGLWKYMHRELLQGEPGALEVDEGGGEEIAVGGEVAAVPLQEAGHLGGGEELQEAVHLGGGRREEGGV